MKQGDFTELAASYVHRAGYSLTVLRVLAKNAGAFEKKDFLVADVGAGTGKLTENLSQLGLSCVAVEPNDAMREEGKNYTAQYNISWRKGSGEATGLAAGIADWVLMGSSFHWVDPALALPEFHRVLKPGGFFTAIWNPRYLEASEFHSRLEEQIYAMVPGLQRKSSGSAKYTQDLNEKLVSTGHFKDPFFMESEYDVVMTKERFFGAWRSVNDIQAQAGPERWQQIMDLIENACADLEEIKVPYKTRAWTVQRCD